VDKKRKTDVLARQRAPKRRRGLSRWEKEIRQRLIVEAVIVVAIVAALVMVSYGYYASRIKPWHQPIVRVNDTVFDMNYFVKILRLYGLNSSSDPSSVESVATAIENSELWKQGLKKEFDVTISDEAIEEKLQEMLSLYSITAEELEKDLASVGISMEDFKQMYIEPSLVQSELRQRIGDQDYPLDQEFEQVRVQAMLVVGADNATMVRDSWLAGEDFDTLVTDYSPSEYYPKTSSDGTTIEWIPQGIESAAFDDYAFADGADNGTLSEPIPDSEGSDNYWLIKVLGKGSRLLSQDDRNTLIGNAWNKWLEDARSAETNEIVDYLDYSKIYWALSHI
jgi:hypothetical protein